MQQSVSARPTARPGRQPQLNPGLAWFCEVVVISGETGSGKTTQAASASVLGPGPKSLALRRAAWCPDCDPGGIALQLGIQIGPSEEGAHDEHA